MTTLSTIEIGLQQYGLTSEQISVYLFLVQHGDETPFRIAKGTKIPRTTVYRILEELRNMSIVTIFKKNNIAHYVAENPRRLLTKIKEAEASLTDVLPAIDALFHTMSNQPHVKLYTGKDGAKIGLDILYEYLENKGVKKMYTYSNLEISKKLPKYLSTVIEKRQKMKIHLKLIASNSPEEDNSPHAQHYKPNAWREVRFLPRQFPFNGTMIIGGSMIACFSLKEGQLHTIILESESITEMLTQFFLYTWESLR